jgi:hypothetical protein
MFRSSADHHQVSSHICHHSCLQSWSSHFRILHPVITTAIRERCSKDNPTCHVLWNVTLFLLTVQFAELEITNGRIGDPHVEHVTELCSDPFRGKWIYSRGDQNSVAFFLNNQQDALIIQIYSVIKLYMFRASSLPIIRSFLLYILHW